MIGIPSTVAAVCAPCVMGTEALKAEERGEGAQRPGLRGIHGPPHQASPLCPTLSLAHLNHDGWEAMGLVMPFPIPVPAYLPILPPDQLPEHRVVRPGGECAGPTAYHLQAPQ